ncbi:MAG: transglycosylase domain-containing protein [Kofleriaceae bacterium]|nr:transglycosylase domain-containing protein [Kofleriaceae bacterium]
MTDSTQDPEKHGDEAQDTDLANSAEAESAQVEGEKAGGAKKSEQAAPNKREKPDKAEKAGDDEPVKPEKTGKAKSEDAKKEKAGKAQHDKAGRAKSEDAKKPDKATKRSGSRTRIEIGNRKDGGVLYWTAKLYAFAFFVLIAGAFLSGVLVYRYYSQKVTPADIPDLANYSQKSPAISRMYAADGSLLAEFAEEWREVTPFDAIPPQLVNAFLAAEDHDFYGHSGLYFKGIARAMWRNVSAGDFAQGGSTITQQVAKQFLSNEKSLTRKAKEAIMARRLESEYSKDAILSLYLNQIYLGNGAYGVKAAARRYFDKKLEELSTGEMATIAGLAQAPSRYSPNLHPKRAIKRRNKILKKMVRYGHLEADKLKELQSEELVVAKHRDIFGDFSPYYTEHLRRYVVDRYGADALLKKGLVIEAAVEPVTDALAYENVDFGAHKQDKRQGWRGPVASLDEKARGIFLERAVAKYGDAELKDNHRYLALVTEVSAKKSTVVVGTREYSLPLKNMRWASAWSKRDATNDVEISNANKAIRVGDVVWIQKQLVVDTEFQSWFLSKGVNPHWSPVPSETKLAKKKADAVGKVILDQVPHPQSAIFTGDHKTGYVVAMVGGTDFDRSVYNRAYQGCRQPGSTYKPIYYSAGFTRGYGFDTSLNDIPRAEVDPVTGEIWTPTNFQGTMDNKVSLEYAMVFSKNVASVDIFKKVGAENVKKWARDLGFTTKIIADKALALGASCTLLHELTHAFAVFARNGRDLDWKWIRRIKDRNGEIVEDNTVFFDPMLSASDRLDRLSITAGAKAEQAIPARAGYLTSKLLRQTIKSGFSGIVRRTGIISAGKTGTSSATMDNTFVSYTSRWITTVWMGDDIRERPLGVDDAAYMTVEPMWARYMKAAADGHPNKNIPWNTPDGVSESDRGDHSKGKIYKMPLVYIRPPKKPEATP